MAKSNIREQGRSLVLLHEGNMLEFDDTMPNMVKVTLSELKVTDWDDTVIWLTHEQLEALAQWVKKLR